MPTETQRATARALRIDTVTGEVVAALTAAGVPSIVIKGPAVARSLYDDGGARPYGDSDVLVPYSRVEAADAVLADLGFERLAHSGDVPSGVGYIHASPWGRERRDFVDLHWSVWLAGADAERVWDTLAAETRGDRIGGAEASVPNGAATALLTALHLAGHGRGATKMVEDLERALARLSRADWRRARELASRVDALEGFATGLRMCPPGATLADELDLPTPSSVRLALLRGHGPGTAQGIETLARATGLRARARILLRALIPARRYLRVRYPWAARGPGWLALAYLYRPLWLARRAVPSILAWRRARRETRTLGGDGS